MTAMPPADPGPIDETSVFARRLQIATYSVLLLVLSIWLLREFRDILQPLFIALFLGFLTNPLHRWLVRRRIPSLVAYGAIVTLVLLGLFAFGSLMFVNFAELAGDKKKMEDYETKLDAKVQTAIKRLPFEVPVPEEKFLRQINISPQQLATAGAAAFGRVADSTTAVALTILYILFLVAEKVSFPARMELAFGEQRGLHILGIVESINLAISQYIAVKTLVSALAGIVSYLVLMLFDVELAATWGILIFLFNYIPYVGSLVAVALPILLSILQFDEAWKPIVIACLLIGIQQGIGNWIEPRMAGQRLDVSPFLIVVSLAFWWFVWGIVGAILAVPLLVIVKIILDNIAETKPIATLISNR